jgi:hypothetical protein
MQYLKDTSGSLIFFLSSNSDDVKPLFLKSKPIHFELTSFGMKFMAFSFHMPLFLTLIVDRFMSAILLMVTVILASKAFYLLRVIL